MGGNIFNLAGPIQVEHIESTLSKFYKELGKVFPNAKQYFKEIHTIGSVGKKPVSGDIDLALPDSVLVKFVDWGLDREQVLQDFRTFKKRSKTAKNTQIFRRAIIVNIGRRISDKSKNILVDPNGSNSGTLFLAFPQYDIQGNELGKHIQIDVNVGDLNWLLFSYYSESYKGNVKGLHRTQLLVSMFSAKGYTFSHNYGIKKKSTQKIVARNPEEAICLLNELYGLNLNFDLLKDYFVIMDILQKNVTEEELHDILDKYMKILDSTKADIPDNLQYYWIENKDRLGLTGKFLPDNSNLKKIVDYENCL